MEELLSKLTKDGLTLSIAEVGCGLPVAHSLMMLDGASNVMKLAVSPYSKDVQDSINRKSEYDVTRSVSTTSVLSLLSYLMDEVESCIYVAYSMQVGVDKCTHGYIGICGPKTDKIVIYHFTLGYGVNKSTAEPIIKSMVEKIIYRGIYQEKINYISVFDGTWTYHGENLVFDPSLLPVNFTTFAIVDGEWKRYTEVLRDTSGDEVGFIKGSFNPLHNGHRQMADKAIELGITPIFSLTTRTIEDKIVSVGELVSRANEISKKAICIIDSSNVLMRDLIRDFHNHRDPDIPLYPSLFMGVDVFSKFDINDVDSDVDVHVFFREARFKNVVFHQSEFPTLSSTKIRESNEIDATTV